jgi:hypothetical protein
MRGCVKTRMRRSDECLADYDAACGRRCERRKHTHATRRTIRETNQHIGTKNRTWQLRFGRRDYDFVPVDLGFVAAPPACFLVPELGLGGGVRGRVNAENTHVIRLTRNHYEGEISTSGPRTELGDSEFVPVDLGVVAAPPSRFLVPAFARFDLGVGDSSPPSSLDSVM